MASMIRYCSRRWLYQGQTSSGALMAGYSSLMAYIVENRGPGFIWYPIATTVAKTTTMWWIVCQYMGQIWFMTPIMQIPRMVLSSLNVSQYFTLDPRRSKRARAHFT